MLKRVLRLLSVGFLSVSLVACQEATIMDLYHAPTEKVEITEDLFTDASLDPYMVEGVLFSPYTVQTPEGSEKSRFYKYALYLGAYKLNDPRQVIINSVKVVGTKNVTMEEMTTELAHSLTFSDEDIQESDVLLLDEINTTDLKLEEDSVVTVIINVSVEANGEMVTRDLTYNLETRSRTYNVQR